MVYGHAKAIGASEGPVVLQRWARPWAPLFSRPSPRHLLPFLRGMLESPGADAGGLAAEAVAVFGPMMMGAAGRVVMAAATATAAVSTPGGDGGGAGGGLSGAAATDRDDERKFVVSDVDAGRALGLLVDICDVSAATTAGPGWGMLRAKTLPLLLTAQPAGVRLATLIRCMASPPAGGLLAASKPAAAVAAATPGKRRKSAAPAAAGAVVVGLAEPLGGGARQDEDAKVSDEVHRLWCAVQLLPHACESSEQAIEACHAVLTAVELAMGAQEVAKAGTAGRQQQQREDVLLLLHGTATRMLATLLPSAAAEPGEGLAEAAEASLSWLMRHPLSFWSARAAGAMLAAAREQNPPHQSGVVASDNRRRDSSGGLQKLLSEASLRSALPPLLPLLSSRSQAVRAAALGVLSAFDTPVLLPLESDVAAGRTGTPIKWV